MLFEAVSLFEPVRIATTPEEKQACARFGYEIYVQELGYTPPGTDHQARVVWDRHDERPSTVHLYAGKPHAIKGTLRGLVWGPGQVDPGFHATYSMHSFPGIDEMKTAEVGRLMIRPGKRGRLLAASLSSKLYQVLVRDHQVDLAFAECRPGLVPAYRKLGMRRYTAPLTQTAEGFMVPLVCVMCDLDYLSSVGALQTSLCRRWYRSGERRSIDLARLQPLFAEEGQRLHHDRALVQAEVDRSLAAEPSTPPLFEGLSPKARARVLDGGLVMTLDTGTEVATLGRRERELYLVLDGRFEVLCEGERISSLGPGEIIGEVAFLRREGCRTATVRAETPGRLLTLRRSFLDRLRKSDPESACTLALNLGRILSDRLNTATEELSRARSEQS